MRSKLPVMSTKKMNYVHVLYLLTIYSWVFCVTEFKFTFTLYDHVKIFLQIVNSKLKKKKEKNYEYLIL